MHSRSFRQCRPSRGDKRRGSAADVSASGGSLRPSHAARRRQRVHGRSMRRGAHAKTVSPSLGAARPIATQLARRRGDPRRDREARGGRLPRESAVARSVRSGTRSFLEGFGRNRESERVTTQRKQRRCGRGSSGSRVCPRVDCVLQKSVGDALTHRSARAVTFLTKSRVARERGSSVAASSRRRAERIFAEGSGTRTSIENRIAVAKPRGREKRRSVARQRR